jgi:hypothetical protein
MKQHTYRITVEHLADAKGAPVSSAPLVFGARNHDDLLAIVARVRSGSRLDADDSAAMILGLKLLGEIVLEHREEPPFIGLRPALGEFIKALKQGALAAREANPPDSEVTATAPEMAATQAHA